MACLTLTVGVNSYGRKCSDVTAQLFTYTTTDTVS
jgi:hypothetical protein